MRLELVADRLDLAYEMRLENLEPITPHLIGPPGIGKSTVVRSWAEGKAKQLGRDFVDFDALTPPVHPDDPRTSALDGHTSASKCSF